MSDTLYERYNVGMNSNTNISGDLWLAQTFTVGNTGTNVNHIITSVKLMLFRVGLPGTLTVGIRAVDGSGLPTGADLTYGTTDANTLTTSSTGEWREIVMDTSYTLTAGTQYAIVVRVSAYDAVCRWRLAQPGSYAGGVGYRASDAGVTWRSWDTTVDFTFEEYGVLTAPSEPRDVYITGYLPRYQKRQVVGYCSESGDLRSIEVNASGHLFTDIEVVTSSGIGVVPQSGIGVVVQSGVHVEQVDVLHSGVVTVLSGLHVWVSGQHMYQESGAFVTSKNVSGGDALQLSVPDTVDIGSFISGASLTNPMPLEDISGGLPLHSGQVRSVVVKSLSTNSGDLYIGGHNADQMPTSGYGLLLEAGEAVTLDIQQVGYVKAFAECSGDKVTWLGVF
jgi:hypothetical protein